MSVKISSDVFQWGAAAPWTPGQRLVLLALADHADDDGVCWPGIARVAEKTGLARETVIRYIKKLRDDGWLTTKKRRGEDGRQMTTVYHFTKQFMDGPNEETGGVTSEPPGDIHADNGVTSLPFPGDICDGHIDSTTISQPSEKHTPVRVRFEKLRNAWNDLPSQYRIGCRGPSAKRLAAIRTRLKDKGWAEQANAALKKIRNGECGFFGSGETGWKPDIEWFLKPDSVLKILENKYRGKPVDALDAQVAQMKKDGTWIYD